MKECLDVKSDFGSSEIEIALNLRLTSRANIVVHLYLRLLQIFLGGCSDAWRESE